MRRRAAASVLLAWLAVALAACAGTGTGGGRTVASLTVRSSAFGDGGTIPSRYTCDGENVSPPLSWSGAPDATQSIAVIVSDPDAGGFVHWLASDVVTNAGLGEGVSGRASGNGAGVEGQNDFGKTGYGGPCPPSGSHRYEFAVYAISGQLGLSPGYSRGDLERAMEGKVLASGTLTGSYQRQSR